MRSVDTFSLTRKAHSATKICQDDQVLTCDYRNNTRISSASCYSSREKVRNIRSRHFNSVFCDETLDRLKSTDNKKKLFLYASQVLGKLKKISKKYNDSQELCTGDVYEEQSKKGVNFQKLKISFRKVNFYYDLLKRLLEERCILLLNEESQTCVKNTQKLVSDLKLLYTNEIVKLTTMPIKSYNRFIDSSGISISILEQLFKKVNYICDLHSSLKNNYHNIINFFHVGFDMELNQMLLKINKFQNHLYSEMFYWTHKILEIFILKLCLADPDSVSPEFLNRVVETCESFNLLLFDRKQINYTYLTNTFYILFNSFIQTDYETVLLDFILQYLSHFEAKVAAEKIIQYLIHECKNRGHGALRELSNDKDKKDIYVSSCNTSDYYSSSPTVAEVEIPHLVHTSTNGTYNIESVFLSFIQRNQSLVLKYLYSIMCLDISVPSKSRNETPENYSDSSTVNKVWNLPQMAFKNRSYLCLEERYWNRFWDKVLTFSLKLVLEVPCHQYGNAAVGVFLFWPQSYHYVIFKFLKSSAETRDIPPAGLNVLRTVFHTLLIHTIQETWDKNMSSALSMIYGQCCMPIPVATNRARTRIGNALCSCLESLGTNFSCEMMDLEYVYLQMFYPFQVTLDCFIYVINTKSRASVSSSDITTYLLISCSDCVHACKLLKEKESTLVFLKSVHHRFFSSTSNQKNCLSKQMEILFGHVSETPNVIHRIISEAVRKTCMYKLKRSHWWICNFDSSFQSGMFTFITVDEILNSFSDIIGHIDDGIKVLSAVASAVANALFSILHSKQKIISSKEIVIIKEVLFDFLKWLEQLNIEEFDREKLKEIKCLKKLLCVVRILETSTLRQRNFRRIGNKVAPSMTDVTPEECMILTEEERLYWRMHPRSHFTICS